MRMKTTIDTDYLIVGAGAAGLAFADALIAESDVDVVILDRRERPGGHWNDAYPIVRLHPPSAYYGVNSLPIGDAIDQDGRNAGWYGRASGAEICDYFQRVLEQLLEVVADLGPGRSPIPTRVRAVLVDRVAEGQ